MISAATGAIISTAILSNDVILSFSNVKEFNYRNTPYYILLGILAGFVSLYHTKLFQKQKNILPVSKTKATQEH
jgi:CIC family chloride channel protein